MSVLKRKTKIGAIKGKCFAYKGTVNSFSPTSQKSRPIQNISGYPLDCCTKSFYRSVDLLISRDEPGTGFKRSDTGFFKRFFYLNQISCLRAINHDSMIVKTNARKHDFRFLALRRLWLFEWQCFSRAHTLKSFTSLSYCENLSTHALARKQSWSAENLSKFGSGVDLRWRNSNFWSSSHFTAQFVVCSEKSWGSRSILIVPLYGLGCGSV